MCFVFVIKNFFNIYAGTFSENHSAYLYGGLCRNRDVVAVLHFDMLNVVILLKWFGQYSWSLSVRSFGFTSVFQHLAYTGKVVIELEVF